jgi:uncharacterized protein YhjY with autotransporter beta-barrel domain/PKD repeat protein
MHYFYSGTKNTATRMGNGRITDQSSVRIAKFVQWIKQNILRSITAFLILLTFILSFSSEAQAASAANGATLFTSKGCTGCHGSPPSKPQLNAANTLNSTLLNYAIANNFGGWMAAYKITAIDGTNGSSPVNASDRADIAAYLASLITAPTVAVAYHGTTAATGLKLTHDASPNIMFNSIGFSAPAHGTVTTGASVASTSSAGTSISEYTATYTHTSNNCTSDSFIATASGPGGSSTGRTVNITVTAPTAPNISTSPTTSSPAYNTATGIAINSTGGPISSISIVTGLSHGGTLTTNGTSSFTYTSNSAAYSATDSFTYKAIGPCANSANVTVNISISAPPTPVINSVLTASGATGVVFGGYQITATNLPTSYNASGLPPGLSINTSTGAITGTPTTNGTYNSTISAINSSGTGSKTLVFTISLSAPVINSVLTANGATYVAFAGYQITATNSPTSFSASGLPPGLSLNTSTGAITGTPTASGTYNSTIHATNATATDTKTLAFTISLSAPVITSTLTASGATGVAFAGYQITANSSPTSYGASGLPPGLSINGSGAISGTPTTAGNYNSTISATNATGTDSKTLAFTISLSAPVITSGLSATGSTGTPFSGYQITASSNPTSFDATGGTGLPPGLSVDTTTGMITGTPTLNGTYSFTISATNATGTGSNTMTITISLTAPVITSTLTASGSLGAVFAGYQITATNTPTSFNATGLPPGLSIDTTTGAITGTPTLNGTFNSTISATNATATDSKTLVFTISLPIPAINSVLTASGATGVAFAGYQITAANNPTSFGASGLPPGLSINASGAISGTPTTAGNYNSTITATNASGTDSKTLAFTISLSAPVINSVLTANGSTYVVFAGYQITATNSPASFNASSLPPGLNINTSTGVISGTPTTAGNYNSTITATNATGTDSKTLAFTIALSSPSITSVLTATGSTGVAFTSYQIIANSSPTSFGASGLPPGLNINTSTGVISGTPTTNNVYNTTITATNATGIDSKILVITISLTAPVINSVLTASGATSVVFAGYQITATNTPTSFNATGLPPGLSIDTTTGAITGTPTLNGTFNSTISATNATTTDSKTLVFTISLTAPAITSANTASGTTGQAFSYQITASNLPTSYAASGLPPGVSVNTSTGLISGTPTAGGTYNATVSATNATATANLAVTMAINFSAPTVANVTANVPYNTATPINLSVTGQYTQVNVATPTHGTAPTPAAGVTTITFTPTTGYSGTDSFTYTATGPGGTSATATIDVTIGTLVPTAGSTTLAVTLNTPASLDLAPFITGSSISGISISTQAAHGTTTLNGTIVTYTPVNNYFGADSFSYLAYGNGGTSTTAGVVTVTVTGRPNPAQDPAVTGLINSQIDTARRFTHAQIVNFTGRLESLHRHNITTRNNDVAASTINTTVNSQRAVVPDKTANDDRSIRSTGESQPNIVKSNSPVTGETNTTVDQPAALVSTDPMGSDLPVISNASKPNPPPIAVKPSTSAATAVQNSSLNVLQGANTPGAANRLMGDGVRFGVRDLANQTTQQNPLVVLATALSASSNGAQSDQSATLGKSLSKAASAIQNSSLNLASSTGTDDGSSTLPGGFDYWVGGGVRFGTRDQTSTSNGLDFTTDGISIGVDKRINNQFAVGMGVGFGRDKTTIGTDGTNDKAHSTTIAAYGSYQPTDAIFIDTVLGYGSLRYKTDRYVPAAADFAHADRSGDHIFTSLTTGYEYRSEGLHLSPYGRLDLAVDRLEQATETGAGQFALTYASQSVPSVAFSLGLRIETAHEMNYGWASPRMRIEFQHDFKGEQQTSVAYADLPATPYAITSTTTNQNSILFGLGSDFILHNGLRLSLDYQIQRSSMHENSQAMLFKLTKELDGKAPPPLLLATSGFSFRDWKIKGDAGYTFDDNINRSSTAAERMSDSSYNAELVKSWLLPVTDHTRLVVGSTLGGEKFHTYTGLDRMYLSSQVEYQYRASGNFGSPIFGIFANATGEAYASTLRDGYRYSGGISLRKPLTDRIDIFSALAHNERHGRSAVFQTRDNSFKFNVDYAATENSTLYLNTEYRRGDLVSSGSHTLQNIDIAKVFTLDDVFTRNDFYDYRFDGSTALFTLGYNLPFGPKDSIDISWQRVRSAASKSPSVAGWPAKHYFDNQLSIVYLFSF